MCVCGYMCIYLHGQIREQLSKVGFLIQLLCGFWVLNSGHQTCSASILTCWLYYVAGPICHFKIHFVDSAIGQKNRIFI